MISEATRIIYIIYFVTHIPITILVDLQALFPGIYPGVVKKFFDYYIETYKDPLMGNPPVSASILYYIAL